MRLCSCRSVHLRLFGSGPRSAGAVQHQAAPAQWQCPQKLTAQSQSCDELYIRTWHAGPSLPLTRRLAHRFTNLVATSLCFHQLCSCTGMSNCLHCVSLWSSSSLFDRRSVVALWQDWDIHLISRSLKVTMRCSHTSGLNLGEPSCNIPPSYDTLVCRKCWTAVCMLSVSQNSCFSCFSCSRFHAGSLSYACLCMPKTAANSSSVRCRSRCTGLTSAGQSAPARNML
jgi:hypothetical protein